MLTKVIKDNVICIQGNDLTMQRSSSSTRPWTDTTIMPSFDCSPSLKRTTFSFFHKFCTDLDEMWGRHSIALSVKTYWFTQDTELITSASALPTLPVHFRYPRSTDSSRMPIIIVRGSFGVSCNIILLYQSWPQGPGIYAVYYTGIYDERAVVLCKFWSDH